jgi:hypothetical protein
MSQYVTIIPNYALISLDPSVSNPAVWTSLTPGLPSGKRAYLQALEATCTAANTTTGYWSILNSRLPVPAAGGVRVVTKLYLHKTATIGDVIRWEFPTPFLSASAAAGAIEESFAIQPSVGTLGTWIFVAYGFESQVCPLTAAY